MTTRRPSLLPPRPMALCRGLSGVLELGDALLIVGPSGCGKSSLLRAIAGLWRSGEGTIRVAPFEQIAFLPQEPYRFESLNARLSVTM